MKKKLITFMMIASMLCTSAVFIHKGYVTASNIENTKIIKQKENYFLGNEFTAPVSYSLALSDQTIQTDTPFIAGDNFLENMSVTVTNISNHPISYVSFTFFIVGKDSVPGKPKAKKKYAYPVAFGDKTWANAVKPSGKYPTLLSIGETKTFPFKGNTFTSLDVAKKNIAVEGHKFEIRLDQVFRTDDILWQGGVMGKRSLDGKKFKRYHETVSNIVSPPSLSVGSSFLTNSFLSERNTPTAKAQSCWKCDDVNVYVACFYPNQDCQHETPDCEEFELGFNQMCEWGYQGCYLPPPESTVFCNAWALAPTFTGCGMPPC